MDTRIMKKLSVMAVAAISLVGLGGCGKTDRDRFEEALVQIVGDKEKVKKELDGFDKLDKDEQRKGADYAEYSVLLKQRSQGNLDDRAIKKLVNNAFKGEDAAGRTRIIEKMRAEMKSQK